MSSSSSYSIPLPIKLTACTMHAITAASNIVHDPHNSSSHPNASAHLTSSIHCFRVQDQVLKYAMTFLGECHKYWKIILHLDLKRLRLPHATAQSVCGAMYTKFQSFHRLLLLPPPTFILSLSLSLNSSFLMTITY